MSGEGVCGYPVGHDWPAVEGLDFVRVPDRANFSFAVIDRLAERRETGCKIEEQIKPGFRKESGSAQEQHRSKSPGSRLCTFATSDHLLRPQPVQFTSTE